ncbi:hypothetical protein BUALT_Bualt18G0034700 [Buddleja alternifolia]|uniref:RRM domain-containing protein n=1 Tax=Buddleja alternifolia TaxID=168488 RepID=A0AAV6W336_9LAMI|nr:hypothetical protein BUALT_Bualt18G0034700 [Buddleja alternifolia]
MSMRDIRGRPRRDYFARSEEKSQHGRGSNLPSRHLWVGNLSHNLTESALAHHFLQFGDLESVAFQPGRSYAFINYKHEEDAFAAVKALQGFVIGGNPLKIEFAKALCPYVLWHCSNLQQPVIVLIYGKKEVGRLERKQEKEEKNKREAKKRERRLVELGRGALEVISHGTLKIWLSQAVCATWPKKRSQVLEHKQEKSLMPSRDTDHSERSPFSPRELRARHSGADPQHLNKSKMNDKDAEPSEVLWIGFPAQLKVDEFILRKAFSPFGEIEKITAFPGRTYAFVRFRNVMAARRAKETLEGKLFGNPRVHICFARSETGPSNRERNSINAPPSPDVGPYGRSGSFEHLRSDRSPPFIPMLDPELGLRGNTYEHANNPSRAAYNRNLSPQNIPRKDQFDDPWDLPEDVSFFHGIKKQKSNTTFPPDNELPEYHPFSDLEKVKLDKNYDSRHSGYRPIPERLITASQSFGERGDHWNASHDNFQVGSIPLTPTDRRRLNLESRESSSKQVWKWEGIIAKGGTSVCRASCFPVGKPPDMLLPEYIDCTARTSLDMLAKHYYQAANAWVVFFVPANDADISYYNEFMNYLGEKQRAAVAKLDDKTTMFLVPPSEFSEKVLKVPGKLSISGVVLKLDPHENENKETDFTSFQSDTMYHKPIASSPSGPYYPTPPFTNYDKPEAPPYIPQGQDYARKPPPGPNWSSPYDLQNSNPSVGSVGPTYSSMARPMQEVGPTRGNGKLPVQENPPILPAEQLAQLASSLLGQQGQWSSGEYKPSENINQGQSGYSFKMSQNYGLPNEQASSELFPQGQFGQVQQFHQQQSPNLVGGQQVGQEDDEADPQKRLQATLQLAASLLQQIKQGKGT